MDAAHWKIIVALVLIRALVFIGSTPFIYLKKVRDKVAEKLAERHASRIYRRLTKRTRKSKKKMQLPNNLPRRKKLLNAASHK